MRQTLQRGYFFLVTLPDHLYPFACEVEGRWVRGRASYEQAVAQALDIYGIHRLGYKLMLYREVFHFLGSILFIVLATLISQFFFTSDAALYTLLAAAIAALTYQEFYLHPKLYNQRLKKGLLDWLAWMLPVAAYFLLFR